MILRKPSTELLANDEVLQKMERKRILALNIGKIQLKFFRHKMKTEGLADLTHTGNNK